MLFFERTKALEGGFIVLQTLLACSFYAWVTMPLALMNLVLTPLCPLPRLVPFDAALAFIGAVSFYMYIYGALRGFMSRYRLA